MTNTLRPRAGDPACSQRGVTMLVVLILLSVTLLGGLAFARLTEVGTLASGNTAYREASIQASEVGLNTVFQRIRDDIVDEEAGLAGWYWPSPQAADAQGIPAVDFDAAPEIVVGAYSVRYIAERMCEGAMPVTEPRPSPPSTLSGMIVDSKATPVTPISLLVVWAIVPATCVPWR